MGGESQWGLVLSSTGWDGFGDWVVSCGVGGWLTIIILRFIFEIISVNILETFLKINSVEIYLKMFGEYLGGYLEENGE